VGVLIFESSRECELFYLILIKLKYMNVSNFNSYKNCQLCPRSCQIDRANSESGYCGETAKLRIAAIEAHFGEEPPISGINGSGTVFFTGCSLQCIYCQNYQISHQKLGQYISVDQVVDKITYLIVQQHIHNVNFVTPDHFFPHTIDIVNSLRQSGIFIPIVYNLSGYQRINSLRMIEEVADIYLPDYKYSDQYLAKILSSSADYPDIALAAISEMVRQKGFLDSFNDRASDTTKIATSGVLVRHLILPGQVKNSIDALTTLFLEFGKNLPISLMSQYYPVKTFRYDFLNRTVTENEFEVVYQHALELGFENMFVQHPEDNCIAKPFLPDFSKKRPFVGNLIK